MAPQQESTSFESVSNLTQTIYIIRHGDRWDYAHRDWKETAERVGDPSLSTLGHEQAREVGKHLDDEFFNEDVHADQITVLSSPFLRTVQTTNEMLAQIKKTEGNVADTVKIKPEYSVFEFDLRNHGFHNSLPDMDERKCYFPRLDESYETAFEPSLPEDRKQFFSRCDKAMKRISDTYPLEDEKNRVVIIVTHAACCIGLVKSATGLTPQDINPASPCSIYKLTRSCYDKKWTLDNHAKEGGMNGFTGHMKDIGTNTRPWNNFGDREIRNGYTGPMKKL